MFLPPDPTTALSVDPQTLTSASSSVTQINDPLNALRALMHSANTSAIQVFGSHAGDLPDISKYVDTDIATLTSAVSEFAHNLQAAAAAYSLGEQAMTQAFIPKTS